MTAKQPLHGIRIIDLTHEWAGPHAARLMADFGAEVIKVEYFKRMDIMRGPVAKEEHFNASIRFRQLARNKRSMILDLLDDTDASVFADLVKCSDVVISNSRPGVLKRLGFDYPKLKTLKENIILISLSASGASGPEASYAGYGGGIEATSGLQSLTGYDDTSEPRRIREMDVTNGIVASAALMTALHKRKQNGVGSWVDLSELETCTHALAGEHLLSYATNGNVALPRGNRHPHHTPHGCYPCQGEDQWIVIAIDTNEAWKRFCRSCDLSDLENDKRFDCVDGRRQHHDFIDQEIARWTITQDKMHAMKQLQAVNVAAGPVLNVKDLHHDPHLLHRRYFIASTDGPDDAVFPGTPFVLSSNIDQYRPGPALGADNHDVTVNLLGRPESDVRVVTETEIGTDFDVSQINTV